MLHGIQSGSFMFRNLAALVARSYRKILAVIHAERDNTPLYVYVTNQGSNNISQYVVAAHGSLIPLAAATIATGTTPVFIALAPSGKHAYVANQGGNSISQYMISANGSLEVIAAPVAAELKSLSIHRAAMPMG
jgi:6-phosphogluconolactonase (cycloisomerase 2 family)